MADQLWLMTRIREEEEVGRSDYVMDPYTCAKVRLDSPRGFVSAHA